MTKQVECSKQYSVSGSNHRAKTTICHKYPWELASQLTVSHTPWNLFSHQSHTIFRLPPNLKAIWSKCGDHIFNEMAVRIEGLMIRIPGITYEAFLVLLKTQHFHESMKQSHLKKIIKSDELKVRGFFFFLRPKLGKWFYGAMFFKNKKVF